MRGLIGVMSCPIRASSSLRLDEVKIDILDAKGASVTGFGARQTPWSRSGLANTRP